jgi:hypothetical protein
MMPVILILPVMGNCVNKNGIRINHVIHNVREFFKVNSTHTKLHNLKSLWEQPNVLKTNLERRLKTQYQIRRFVTVVFDV